MVQLPLHVKALRGVVLGRAPLQFDTIIIDIGHPQPDGRRRHAQLLAHLRRASFGGHACVLKIGKETTHGIVC